jgi:glycosyltransferase involved in cell wall biosynthesis
LILTFNASRLAYADVATTTLDLFERCLISHPILLPVENGTYCVQKNHGALRSSGELLIFLDSDVIPQDGWLLAMIKGFHDDRVDAAVGNTYTDYSDDRIYSRTFALTWMFPERRAERGICLATDFYANNFAIRRSLFLERPFEDVPGFLHGAARRFVSKLEQRGIQLWEVMDAQASHPPPNGIRHFCMRALAAGRADALNPGPSTPKSILRFVGRSARHLAYRYKVVTLNRRSVSLRLSQLPMAMFYCTTYDLLILLGFLGSKAFPSYMQGRLDL